jgi:glycosyltransferase involved in cell wall biosynthesis
VTPLVSVLVPTYRRPLLLRETLESALAQTWPEREILVSDDDPDGSAEEVVAAFADPRIRYSRQPERRGPVPNAVELLHRARGTYLAHLHDDDRWAPEFLTTLIAPLERDPDLVVAFCDHHVTDEQGGVDEAATERVSRTFGRAGLAPGVHRPFCRLALISRSIAIGLAAVIRFDALDLEAFPPDLDMNWDRWISYLLCRTGRGAWYEPERLAYYRSHPASITATGGVPLARRVARCSEALLADDDLAELRPELRPLYAEHLTSYGIALIRDGQAHAARPELRKALHARVTARTLAALAAASLPPPIARRAAPTRARLRRR